MEIRESKDKVNFIFFSGINPWSPSKNINLHFAHINISKLMNQYINTLNTVYCPTEKEKFESFTQKIVVIFNQCEVWIAVSIQTSQ